MRSSFSGSVHFEGLEAMDDSKQIQEQQAQQRQQLQKIDGSCRTLMTAPPAPPEQHKRSSIFPIPVNTNSDGQTERRTNGHRRNGSDSDIVSSMTFGGLSRFVAVRSIRREEKKSMSQRWNLDYYEMNSSLETNATDAKIDVADEETALVGHLQRRNYSQAYVSNESFESINHHTQTSLEALRCMFLENKINVLLLFLPLAYWSHAAHWSGASIFILNFLAMVPLASMLGVFTEELAAHTNDIIGGLINATFGNAVELVVAIQALLAEDYRVVQASLIGSVFSNLLLVLGMCFLVGGIKYSEQKFIAVGAAASIALLGLSGLTLFLPEQFQDDQEEVLTISRIGACILIFMYALLLFFQLKTHAYLFDEKDDVDGEGDIAMLPFSWALIGLVVITAIVTVLSEFLVGSIDGFCNQFHLGRSFVGVIIIPVVGNAVEHISAVSVAYKNKMDLALGVALGSSVQIALFVLPVVVVIGWFTGKELTLKFPSFEVYLYLISIVIASLCLANQRTNWLEGALLISTYIIIGVGIYFEKITD